MLSSLLVCVSHSLPFTGDVVFVVICFILMSCLSYHIAGEALNVLLRILNERTYEEQDLPLKCAIATANAPRDDMYVEPLDPGMYPTSN